METKALLVGTLAIIVGIIFIILGIMSWITFIPVFTDLFWGEWVGALLIIGGILYIRRGY